MKNRTPRATAQIALLTAAAMLLLTGFASTDKAPKRPILGSKGVPILSIGKLRFRDLNRDGKLEPFEDWRIDAQTRALDLLKRLSVAEKAGLMMHGTIQTTTGLPGFGNGAVLDEALMTPLIKTQFINTFISRIAADASALAGSHNKLQALAEDTRFAIPVSISTDPRNHFDNTIGQSVEAGSFSKWPQPLGFGAINDPALTKHFADVMRQEYLAVGLNVALSPQAELATEPRWPRVYGTFGEDPDAVSQQVGAYVAGLQQGSKGLHPGSVVAVVKHWVGYGAAKDGWDSHNPYGKYMTFPGGDFEKHLHAFDGAFAAKAGSIMPTYSEPDGTLKLDGKVVESVGAGYNKALLTDLLRGRKGFKGVTLSDFLFTNDCAEVCTNGNPPGTNPFQHIEVIGMPWGVEGLSRRARFVKAVKAGLDQFGGTEESHFLIEAVAAGELAEADLNGPVERILEQKFRQGLFENPFVDEAAAAKTVGQPAFLADALDAQRKSLVLLQNSGKTLPLKAAGKKVFLYGVDAAVAARYGFSVVTKPAEADLAIVRIAAPYEVTHPAYLFGLIEHEGSLAYVDGNPDYEAVKAAAAAKLPTIVTVYLERPAILVNIVDKAAAVLGNFGVGDEALLDVITGKGAPKGHLPLELPRSMDAVRQQKSDVPHDSASPLFPYGFGLSY